MCSGHEFLHVGLAAYPFDGRQAGEFIVRRDDPECDGPYVCTGGEEHLKEPCGGWEDLGALELGGRVDRCAVCGDQAKQGAVLAALGEPVGSRDETCLP